VPGDLYGRKEAFFRLHTSDDISGAAWVTAPLYGGGRVRHAEKISIDHPSEKRDKFPLDRQGISLQHGEVNVDLADFAKLKKTFRPPKHNSEDVETYQSLVQHQHGQLHF